MPSDRDLFSEEQSMVTMSFGDHIEELRARLILGLLGLMVGVVLTFIPPLDLGKRVMTRMQAPAQVALDEFYTDRANTRSAEARTKKALTPQVAAVIPAEDFVGELRKLAPGLDLPTVEALKGKDVRFRFRYDASEMIQMIPGATEPKSALITLAPLEAMTIYFMVCLVAGLVVASPWVFYQVWAFIAAGLYRHEQHYVTKFLPLSLGLFLTGVFGCFFGVLPITMKFLLNFNVWLVIEPTLRLVDWMSFATILPLVFGACFQTPLIMLFLERIGVFSADDYREKRRIAILIIFIAGAVLTPGQDPFSMCMLAIPMLFLYELGILLIGKSEKKTRTPASVSG
jgi:sec-independent protein translocase protein TatC